MSEVDIPEDVRIEKSGSLTGVARYIAHRKIVSRRELRKLFTNQAVRTALCYLKLVDAVYDDGEYVSSLPWLLYLKLKHGDSRWITELERLTKGLRSIRLDALINEVNRVSNTPWIGFVRDAIEASKAMMVVERLSERIQREFTCAANCSGLASYISWLVSVYASTLMHLMSLGKISRKHLYISLKRQLESLAKIACIGEEDVSCLTVKTLLEVIEIVRNYLKEGYISTFAKVREHYDTRLYGLREQTRRNAYSTILSFVKATIAEVLTDYNRTR